MGDIREQVASLERGRPDPEQDPEGFRRVNEKISKLINDERTMANPSKRRGVI